MWIDLNHQRRWRKKHLNHCKNYGRKWRKRNPDYKKQWQKNHSKEISQYRQKSRLVLHELKINGCAICGYNKCDRALQFHHVNPEDKKFNITSIQMSKKGLVAELNKCILLCANCHLEIHAL